MGKKDLVRINFNVPRDVRDDFKSKCYRRGKSMKEILVRFMTTTKRG